MWFVVVIEKGKVVWGTKFFNQEKNFFLLWIWIFGSEKKNSKEKIENDYDI
jgi:hypothetical protein